MIREKDVRDEHVAEFSPRSSGQWWRMLTAIYLHQGILDCVLITLLQKMGFVESRKLSRLFADGIVAPYRWG